MKNQKHVYRRLFASTFYLSAFTFGGGYVIIPLMKKKFVDDLQWIEEEEMLNLTAIAQSSPGAVAVNAAILLGYRVAGISGALVTILGTILPPFITLSIISIFYTAFRDNTVVNAVLKGMQAGVAAVIADVVMSLGSNVFKQKDIVSVIVMVGAFISTFFFGINVMYIILVCGCIGAVKILIQMKKVQKDGDPQ
ncbi:MULTISPECIES: chromate transporter [Bacillota]|uniref:Chromate transporter n=4 Tax=Bacillota TaxID=1239 RepID=A0A1H2ULD4_9FIRM|nr:MULTISPECIES: chromate transporter [Bacillota]ANX01785.1 chromate transporter [Thermoclostridium stercorarium subsp. leptospartum DSM 9219]RBP56397.1 chromate transporter [Herbinix hemicellulosilytica]CRZ33883.1 putative membrane protein [Herbinix hemicellulosilytica]SCN23969.1 Chromate transport protein [Clostridium sp. N3C]SDW56768.1 chromate transporter [Tepidimicrobium xylanilyticum]